mgnify:CR=1 FL=1
MNKHTPIHKSWKEKAGQNYSIQAFKNCYMEGAIDFRAKALEALELFSVLTNEEVVMHKNKAYVSRQDVVKLIEGLYAETKTTKVKQKLRK